MKRIIYVMIVLLGSVTFLSCNSEEAEPENKIVDPCENVTCLNDGYCYNGNCICPEGYTGEDCSEEVEPTSIKIDKISIYRFPETDNGSSWDLTSGADIYIKVNREGNELYKSSYWENAEQSFVYNAFPTDLSFTAMYDEYIFYVYDDDGSLAPDFMGGVSIFPYKIWGGFPETLNLDAGGNVAFHIELSYTW